MKQYAPNWHTEHMEKNRNVGIQVMNLRNRSTGTEVRVVIHGLPCALCCAVLAEAIWPNYSIQPLHFEVAEITDAPTATPPEA